MRRLVVATMLAGMLLIAGMVGHALADIPDNGGTKLSFCVYNEAGPAAQMMWNVLDTDKGNGQCASSAWTKHTITVVPDP